MITAIKVCHGNFNLNSVSGRVYNAAAVLLNGKACYVRLRPHVGPEAPLHQPYAHFYNNSTITGCNKPLDVVCVSASSGLQHRDVGNRFRNKFAGSIAQISGTNQNLFQLSPPSAT